MSQISFDRLSLEEVEQIEEITGKNLDELLVAGRAPGAKTIRAFGLVVARRTNPAVTLDDIGAMSYLEVVNLIADDKVEVPSTPKAGVPARRAPSSKRR